MESFSVVRKASEAGHVAEEPLSGGLERPLHEAVKTKRGLC